MPIRENGPADGKPINRRLAAIISADVAGYSLHVHENELETLAAFKGHLNNLIEPMVVHHGGRVFNIAGDGVFAEFPSAVAAVACAVEIQGEMARCNSDPSAGRQLEFRIGVNLGEVVFEDKDVLGEGVIIAARLQSLASPNSICVSEDIYRQVYGKLDIEFEDLGNCTLKNIPGSTRVFRVGPTPDDSSRHFETRRIVRPDPSPMLAVLPFDNLSGDPDQGYFSDGITNDLITDLSRFPDLGVIASHSVFTYKGKAIKTDVVARELSVQYVVEGSVQRADQIVRINAQLVDAPTGRHLWSERYKHDLKELFSIQDEIVKHIAAIVVAHVEISELERAVRKPTASLAAYDHYLRGKDAWYGWTLESNAKAQAHFKKALELDPNFSRAYNGLSYMLIQSALGGWSEAPAEALNEARALAERAVALGPSDFENLAQLALACLYCRQFARSIASYERALQLNRNSADLLAEMADALVHVGRTAEGVAMIEQAKRLNPICPDWYDWILGIAAFHEGRYEQALAAFTRLGDHSNFLRSDLVATYVRLGRMAEARALAVDMMKLQPNYSVATERLRPFKDPAVLDNLIADLRLAGLPG